MSRGAYFTYIFLGAVVGCGQPPPAAPTVTKKSERATSSSAATTDTDTSISDAQKQVFVDRMINFVEGRQESDDGVDFEALARRVTEKVQPGKRQDAKLISAVSEGFRDGSLAVIFRKEVQSGGQIRFLRFREREKNPTALFRMIYANGSMAYFEYALQLKPESRDVKAFDVFVYATYEWLSDSEASAILIANSKSNFLKRLAEGTGVTETDEKLFDELSTYFNEGQWKKVLSNYSRLSAALRKSKYCLMIRYVASQKGKDFEELRRCIEDFRANFKNDPSIAFLSLDYFNMKNEFGKTLAALDMIDEIVGGDPYLDVQRTMALNAAGDISEAKKFAARAVEREPTLVAAHLYVATFAQSENDFKAVAAAFRAAEKVMQIDSAFVETLPEFAPFVASPEFKAWKAESEARK